MKRRLATYAVLLPLLWLAGCQHSRIQEVQRREQGLFSRELYAPLASGQEALLRNLPTVSVPACVFSLSASGARPLTVLAKDRYWEEDKAVFLLAAAAEGAAPAWQYLNPRSFALQPLVAGGPAGDLALTGASAFSLFRAAAVTGQGPGNAADLEIFRYDFTLTSAGPEYQGCQRITREPGADLLPMPYKESGKILYLHAPPGGVRELRCTAWTGGVSFPLLRRENLDVRYPRQEADGRLVFAANPEGHYQLYEIADLRAALERLAPRGGYLKLDEVAGLPGALTPFHYTRQAPDMDGTCFVASMGENGRIQPRVVALPAELQLKEILSLVMAHNASINQQRARLAAALARVDEPRLYNWPLINLGVDLEDALNLLFDLPRISTGDTLSRQLVRGLAGFVVPLFDYRQNASLSEASRYRAAIEASGVQNEVNERLADAAEAYFEARYLGRQTGIDQQLIELSEARLAHFTARRALGESIPLQIMAVEQVLSGLRSDLAFHRDREAFLLARLRDLCGLPRAAAFGLAGEDFDFVSCQLPSIEAMQDIALLNHPRVAMIRDEIAESTYFKEAGHPIDTSGALTATYELGFREFDRVVTESTGTTTVERSVPDQRRDEIGTLGVSAQVPLAGRKARKTHEAAWDARIEALLLAERQESQNIAAGMHEAFMDFAAAQRDHEAKASSESYFLEKIRVARVQVEAGISDLSAPVETDGVNALSPLTAREEYLSALGKRASVEKDLGLRYVKLWRELGMTAKLTEPHTAWAVGIRNPTPASTWIWKTCELLDDEAAMPACVDTLRRAQVSRVYVYLYSDSQLLGEARMEQRLLRFLNLCHEQGIAVWALLGEPEWMSSPEGTVLLKGAIERLMAFNAARQALEPRFEGVKLDLEPHTLPSWQADAVARQTLSGSYVALLRAARATLPAEIPLWADVPVQFFREEHDALRATLEDTLDGATVMCYFDNEAAIAKWAGVALQTWHDPLEVAVELNAAAPAADTVAAWPLARVQALREQLEALGGAHASFTGVALHDFEGLSRFWKSGVPDAH